ncbi:MAG: Flp pilus assembly complex ATPase component TadA [Planctomycetaceae bacterium]|nr:Flp pilus assembly complex ATPase component TadA [Planctomycetaceae bacterium]
MQDPIMTAPAILAEALILMSVAKPLLFLAAVIAYARFAAKLELDARFFNLPVLAWNFAYVGVLAVALVATIFIPIFWIGWILSVALLAGTLFGYWKFRNKRVPETAKFHLGGGALTKAIEARKKASAEKSASVFFIRADKSREPVPQKEDPALGVYLAVESVLAAPLEARASRVDLVSSQGGVAVSMLVDGVRVKRDSLAPDVGNAVIDMLKRIAGLDVNDRRRRQAGAFRMDGESGSSSVAITSIGSSGGQSIRLDFDREQRVIKAFESLGLEPSQLEALRKFEDVGLRRGVILVSAPAGQGLTTLGYSLISRHDAYTSNVKTLEREMLARVEGVDHTVFSPQPGAEDFGAMLTKIIRRDPDVVLCGDISEPGSAKAATLMGMQSPLVYVLVPADSMATAIATWMQAVGDPKVATKSLSAVVHQRLMRTLCPNCKSPFTPAPEQAKKLGIPSGKQVELYRPSGKVQVKNRIEDCPVCQGSAYFGQEGIFEVLSLDDEGRRMLAENDFRSAYARSVREQKMIQLQEAALLKVRKGATSLEEVQRIFAPKQAPAQAKPAPTQQG